MDEQVLPRELHALLNSLTRWDSWECSIWNSADFTFLKPLTLNPLILVFMLQIHYPQVAIVTPEGNNPPCLGKVGHVQYSVQCWSGRGLNPQLLTQQTGALADCAYQTAEFKKS